MGDCGGARETRPASGRASTASPTGWPRASAEREQLDRERQQLIADISHDLKTPVTVIAGYVDALCRRQGPARAGRPGYLRGHPQPSAAALTELINAFHEYSKVEHPRLCAAAAVAPTCANTCGSIWPPNMTRLSLAGFSLQVDIPEVPCRLCPEIDPFELRRALDNLLANALRYNRLGTVLSVSLRGGRGRQAVLTGGRQRRRHPGRPAGDHL